MRLILYGFVLSILALSLASGVASPDQPGNSRVTNDSLCRCEQPHEHIYPGRGRAEEILAFDSEDPTQTETLRVESGGVTILPTYHPACSSQTLLSHYFVPNKLFSCTDQNEMEQTNGHSHFRNLRKSMGKGGSSGKSGSKSSKSGKGSTSSKSSKSGKGGSKSSKNSSKSSSESDDDDSYYIGKGKGKSMNTPFPKTPSPSGTPTPFTTAPTALPTLVDAIIPFTEAPTSAPSSKMETPSDTPSMVPSDIPSVKPSTDALPSLSPQPTTSETPSFTPTESLRPTLISENTSTSPSENPSSLPSQFPSSSPSNTPSSEPSAFPSQIPSSLPLILGTQEDSLNSEGNGTNLNAVAVESIEVATNSPSVLSQEQAFSLFSARTSNQCQPFAVYAKCDRSNPLSFARAASVSQTCTDFNVPSTTDGEDSMSGSYDTWSGTLLPQPMVLRRGDVIVGYASFFQIPQVVRFN